MTEILKEKEKVVKRVVHARYVGVEVVRYGRRWFLEPGEGGESLAYPYKRHKPVEETKRVSLKEAALAAAHGVREAWDPNTRIYGGKQFQIFWGRGSRRFDEIVKSIYPWFYIEIKKAKLEGLPPFWVMRCPGCREWVRIDASQKNGNACIDHDRYSGGCGFHGYTFGRHAGYVPDLGISKLVIQKPKVNNVIEKKKK